jgi:hypothetical protein
MAPSRHCKRRDLERAVRCGNASLRTTFEKIVQELTREAKSVGPCCDGAQAKQAADAAKTKLDAWLGADATLNNRLNDIDKAIKDVQSVFGGADQVFSIYLQKKLES